MLQIPKNLIKKNYAEVDMQNKIIIFLSLLLLPLSANALDLSRSNGLLSVPYAFYILVPALLIHLMVTLYFQKKGYYRSKSFTTKHLAMVVLIPVVGIGLLSFEYLTNMGNAGMHVGSYLSILFVYVFMAILFALPYPLHLFAPATDYHSK